MVKYLLMLAGFVLLLSSCSVYESVFHPHRLASPPMSAAAKAKAKAADKARHQGLTLKKEEAITDEAGADKAAAADPAAPAGAADPPPDKPKAASTTELPEATKLTYNKQGLLKRSKLDRMTFSRRSRHYYETRPLAPREASRENRRLRKHGSKGHGRDKDSPAMDAPARSPAGEDRRPAAPAPQSAPAQPVKAAKAEKVEVEKVKAEKPEKVKEDKPEKVKAEKVKSDKKTKKAPVPKPDPTQPQPFKGDQ